MFAALLVAAAAAFLYADKAKGLAENLRAKAATLDTHHYLAAGCLALAAFIWYSDRSGADPVPPEPPPALDLRGKFHGETAASDAASVSALCDELARELEWDGQQASPLIKTGVAFDELRVRSRQLLCRGESIGDRQPQARADIEQYLNDHAGTSGGPLTPESRARWVAAYRDVAEAAGAAAR